MLLVLVARVSPLVVLEGAPEVYVHLDVWTVPPKVVEEGNHLGGCLPELFNGEIFVLCDGTLLPGGGSVNEGWDSFS